MEVDGPIPLVLVGPDGPCGPQITRAVSYLHVNSRRRSRSVRIASDFAWFLNRCIDHYPSVVQDFERSVEDCRALMDNFITKVLQVELDPDGGFDRFWLSPPPELHRKVSSALWSIGQVTALLAKAHYDGQDPAKLDNADQSKLKGGTQRSRDGGFQSERFRRYRIASNITISPRFEDPRVSERWLSAAERCGVPDVFLWLVRLARKTGARTSSLLPLNVYSMLVGAPLHGEIRAPLLKNKKRRWITLVMGDESYTDIEMWVDGELRRWHGTTLAECRNLASIVLAGSKVKGRFPDHLRAAREKLESYRLFMLQGSPVTYDQLSRVFRNVAVSAGLVYRPDRPTDNVRSIVFHHLRHEYVFSMLERIAGLPPEQRDAERTGLAYYMGWSLRETMLEWYSNHYEQLFGIHRAHEAANEAEIKLSAQLSGPVAPPILTDIPAFDPNMEGF